MADSGNDTSRRRETPSRKSLLGPILAGLMLDLLDFATYGPIGIWFGLVTGGLGGYFLASSMGVRRERRIWYALVAGLYCMLPFTAFLPVATVLGALIQLRENDPPGAEPEAGRAAIEAEYESRWEDE